MSPHFGVGRGHPTRGASPGPGGAIQAGERGVDPLGVGGLCVGVHADG